MRPMMSVKLKKMTTCVMLICCRRLRGVSFTMGSGPMSGDKPRGSMDDLKGFVLLGAAPKGEAVLVLKGFSVLLLGPALLPLAKGLAEAEEAGFCSMEVAPASPNSVLYLSKISSSLPRNSLRSRLISLFTWAAPSLKGSVRPALWFEITLLRKTGIGRGPMPPLTTFASLKAFGTRSCPCATCIPENCY
eukprot:CAMPEP_0202905984 /NCGR_PEP_ID=MMETSP1392-20130828/36916_1 /ASSEMBLY_ACC=CAM_ASM_000868 /TAXON_ID=225041 /ORGANISM="Chlamydomonas chlamydogama, Strain SAG 11-48b" /LENGTH=189 /DNA_ID=CAMNT_0049594315 /DNA_START=660 /DNA_END=1229 /DNA_ORIENTATION=+